MKGAARTEGKGTVPGPTLRQDSENDISTGPRISYMPHPEATPEGEVVALAAVYQFLLDTASRRIKGAETADRDEGEEEAGQGHAEGHAPEKGRR